MAEAQVQPHSLLTLVEDGGGWSTLSPSHFTTKERTPGCVAPTATLISAVCEWEGKNMIPQIIANCYGEPRYFQAQTTFAVTSFT
jgi:hypothetical protein